MKALLLLLCIIPICTIAEPVVLNFSIERANENRLLLYDDDRNLLYELDGVPNITTETVVMAFNNIASMQDDNITPVSSPLPVQMVGDIVFEQKKVHGWRYFIDSQIATAIISGFMGLLGVGIGLLFSNYMFIKQKKSGLDLMREELKTERALDFWLNTHNVLCSILIKFRQKYKFIESIKTKSELDRYFRHEVKPVYFEVIKIVNELYLRTGFFQYAVLDNEIDKFLVYIHNYVNSEHKEDIFFFKINSPKSLNEQLQKQLEHRFHIMNKFILDIDHLIEKLIKIKFNDTLNVYREILR